MAEIHSPEHAVYVLLHGGTGAALYTTCATEAEIHRANRHIPGGLAIPPGMWRPGNWGATSPACPTPRAEHPAPGEHQASSASTPRVPLARRRRLALAKAAAVLLAEAQG